MAQAAPLPRISVEASHAVEHPRHPAWVRVTHWLTTVSFVVLLVSGIAILLAHPRLYWGETGAIGSPSLIDLPLPFVLDVPIRGPGRYLHFLFAWVSLFTGLVYIAAGIPTRYVSTNLLPKRADLTIRGIRSVVENHLRLKRPTAKDLTTYNVLQRLSYTTVVFVLAPLILWTGLGMSPAVTSVFPVLVTVFGGQQSARTIHFFVACALVLFFMVHVAMVCQSGFRERMRAMITGHGGVRKEPS